jgi:transcription antitermination factor NusG
VAIVAAAFTSLRVEIKNDADMGATRSASSEKAGSVTESRPRRRARAETSAAEAAAPVPVDQPPAPNVGWFAVWTRSRHEDHVRLQLERKGMEVFLPTIARWSRWKDRKKKIDWPLFPGYCFVRIDPVKTLAVLTCKGAVRIVSSEGKPAAIPDLEIEGIRTLVESELHYDPCPLIKVGTKVDVISGPLKGVSGLLVRKGTHARLVLSVNLIGQGVSVQVDAADVRPA